MVRISSLFEFNKEEFSIVKIQSFENPQFIIIILSIVSFFRINILFWYLILDTITKLGRFNQVGKII